VVFDRRTIRELADAVTASLLDRTDNDELAQLLAELDAAAE